MSMEGLMQSGELRGNSWREVEANHKKPAPPKPNSLPLTADDVDEAKSASVGNVVDFMKINREFSAR